MHDDDCVALLQWALPRLGFRWEGYRKVRGQVCKRIDRRTKELGVDDYRAFLETNPDEWKCLAFMCRITISRFYRDHRVFDRLVDDVLPQLKRRRGEAVRCWSAGCASGEEPYTLQIGWMENPGAAKPLEIVATDVDPHMLERARRACYQRATLKELPDYLVEKAFDDDYCLYDTYKIGIEWLEQDIREEMPEGVFDLVLCRNLAFMYFDEKGRRDMLEILLKKIRPEGALVIGKHDVLPDHESVEPWFETEKIYRITDGRDRSAPAS